MSNLFQLIGLGDSNLENKINNAIRLESYTIEELLDERVPVQCNYFDHIYNFYDIEQKKLKLQQISVLTPDTAVSQNITNIKTLIKKIISKFLKWYIVPMANSQTSFNQEISDLLFELIFALKRQNATIKNLQNELCEIKKKNV